MEKALTWPTSVLLLSEMSAFAAFVSNICRNAFERREARQTESIKKHLDHRSEFCDDVGCVVGVVGLRMEHKVI